AGKEAGKSVRPHQMAAQLEGTLKAPAGETFIAGQHSWRRSLLQTQSPASLGAKLRAGFNGPERCGNHYGIGRSALAARRPDETRRRVAAGFRGRKREKPKKNGHKGLIFATCSHTVIP